MQEKGWKSENAGIQNSCYRKAKISSNYLWNLFDKLVAKQESQNRILKTISREHSNWKDTY